MFRKCLVLVMAAILGLALGVVTGEPAKAACSALAGGASASRAALTGRVSLGDADVRGARVTIRQLSTGRILGRTRTNQQGFFLVPRVKKGVRVEIVARGGRAHGKAIRGSMRNRVTSRTGKAVWVTPETTVVTNLRSTRRMPRSRAITRARRALGLISTGPFRFSFGHARFDSGQMSSRAILQAARRDRGLNGLLAQRTRLALSNQQGKPFRVAGKKARLSADAPVSATTSIGGSLASGAIGAIGSLAMGWFMQEVGIPTAQETEMETQFSQLSGQLVGISNQIDDLSSQVAQLSTQVNQGLTTIENQLDTIEQQLDDSTYNTTFTTASSQANAVQSQLMSLQALISQAATNPSKAEWIVQTAQQTYQDWLANPCDAPTTLFNNLNVSVSGTVGTGTIYKQLTNVLAGPGSNVLNQTSSAALQNSYAYWQAVMTQAYYIALEFEHAEAVSTTTTTGTYNFVTGCSLTAINCAPLLAAPMPLPTDTALQVATFYSSQTVVATVTAGQALMWVTGLVPNLTASPTGAPETELTWSESLTNSGGTFPVSLPAADGSTVSNWVPAVATDVEQLTSFAAAGSNPAQGVANILGLTSAYAAMLQEYGFWDPSENCLSQPSFLVSVGTPGVQCVNGLSAPGTPPLGSWFAYRVESDPGKYLPAA